jgi:phosphoglycolate phosphatase
MDGPIRRLILWDIDGTLLTAGPVAREAFYAAAGDVLGREVGDLGVQMSGKTDPLIAVEILEGAGVEPERAMALLPSVLAALERRLGEEADRMRRDGRTHPGVVEVLQRLERQAGVLQSVLTGNQRANAEAKVAAFGLEGFLDLEVGAYGSDHHDRERLVPVALERLQDLRGITLGPDAVWVVGDTPRDLACARAGGARCLLVATGRIALAELDGIGADAVLPDLSATERVVRLLLDGVCPA